MKDLKTKLSYGSGDIYGGGALLIFSLLYMNYLVLVENIPVVFVTTIILIGKIWDAITDPSSAGSLTGPVRGSEEGGYIFS